MPAGMKLTAPKTLESWLLWIGFGLLAVMGLLYGVAVITAHEQAHVASGQNSGITRTSIAFGVSAGILELAGLGCIALSALVSIFRSLFSSVFSSGGE